MVVTYTGSNAGFGWYQKRQFGGMLNPSAKIVIGPVDASTIAALGSEREESIYPKVMVL
ncbi:hypothetical protein LEP1GSC188_4012 [Leptospira weilii serovar Topaz str. LT2116]|uniref:Uncharacterized protein n=1 Tax=Leptospira weilii serovar Topaz str. LT2116 TaxID=1088540 RepID=M3ET62_9LEPT|nr:hypothetical protein LEP1GSC188_4012 [Leptospira weilii serovar Topaz str. LT2116]